MRDPEAQLLMEEIMAAASPEEAARLGRGAQRTRPHLVSPDWETSKLFVMYAGLKAKARLVCPFSSRTEPAGLGLSAQSVDTCALYNRLFKIPLRVVSGWCDESDQALADLPV